MYSIILVLIGSTIVLITFIILILFIPFKIFININKSVSEIDGNYRLVWLGITVRSGDIFAPGGSRIPKVSGESELKKDESWMKPKNYPKLDNSNIVALLDALPAIIKLLKELIATLRIEKLNCRISIGFPDPVDTAVISGYIWSLISALRICNETLWIEPYFEKERLDGSILAEIKAQLIWMFITIFYAIRDEKLRNLLKNIARRE